jgi:Zn ribbon nucleic-acid-binding protein
MDTDMDFLIHTDLGHDPDDALAIAFLIEQGLIPRTLSITPGYCKQVLAARGMMDKLNIHINSWAFSNPNGQGSANYNPGKHQLFMDGREYVTSIVNDNWKFDKALVIGPALNIGDKLECEELYFQGGYSPNSNPPLEKFVGKEAVPSFNPSGAKHDFNLLLHKPEIKRRYYIGKNVCHGFTKQDMLKLWKPNSHIMLKFCNSLGHYKKMHDVLAAMLFANKEMGIWEQAEPVWQGNLLTTKPTDREVYTLIGVRI